MIKELKARIFADIICPLFLKDSSWEMNGILLGSLIVCGGVWFDGCQTYKRYKDVPQYKNTNIII